MVTPVTMVQQKTWQQLIFETLVYDPETGIHTPPSGEASIPQKEKRYSFVSVRGEFYPERGHTFMARARSGSNSAERNQRNHRRGRHRDYR